MKPHDLTHEETAEPPLCLRYRQSGHKMTNCFYCQWFPELYWFFSPARKSLHFGNGSETAQEECTRCGDLDIVRFWARKFFHRHKNKLYKVLNGGSKYIWSLGKRWSAEFWSNCSLHCCLFALPSHSSSGTQDMLILPYWGIYCLVSGIDVDAAQSRRYAKHLLLRYNQSKLVAHYLIGYSEWTLFI